MRPVACGDQRYKCGERHDVKFCENVALAVEGADCASVGLAAQQRFCFVSSGRCVQTEYALTRQDCRVLRYEPVQESDACSPGTPTFGP
jgi:hypothetical protein